MSQHQTTSASKTTNSTHKVSAPSMDIHDDEILDVVPLSVIPYEALDLNHPMDASASTCPNQGYSMKGVSTPLSKMYPSPEVEQHSEKIDDSSSSEKDMAAEGLCSLGQTVSGKGKFVASKTANASHSEKHDDANDVIDLEDDRKTKKTAGIGPSKSWSKVEGKKRNVREVSESEEDVEEDVPDISPMKKTTVRKSPGKVVVVHLDNISFHLEDGAAKWKFVIQRRVAVERELGKDVVEIKEVMDLIKAVGLLKTVAGFSQCYEGLVKEFIVNIPEDIADKNNKEFCKVFVRGKCITFFPIVINNFLGRRVEGAGELEATDNEQHPGILSSNDLPSRRKPSLSVYYKLFEGSHVEDIVMTSAMKKPSSKV
ncbi:uncharacterized protein LOC127123533 [Lathyrus oleraceus]|uniref:uncharacterized protein LOC127123533 n=1 Tax=Pisum sativum TaxID=3888 RepID=UPI0021D2B27E|nr:uncharacterized protein LOC127123533 [Pisum sativum]